MSTVHRTHLPTRPPLRGFHPWIGFVLVVFLCGCPGPGTTPGDEGNGAGTLPALEEVIRHNILGTSYLGQQRWVDAEAAFRQAIELSDNDPVPHNNLAVALLQQGKNDEAYAALQQALDQAPNDPYAHYNLGLFEKNQGNFETAATHFRRVADYDPNDLLTQYNLGIVLSRTGEDDAARRAFENALAQNPTHVSSLYGFGQFLLRRGEEDRGRELVARSAQIRARSGLDVAVGTQYGEQGPYAMGADYPGSALAAPEPIAVRFRPQPISVAAAASSAVVSLLPPTESAPASLVLVDGTSLVRVDSTGAPQQLATLAGPPLGLAAGDLDDGAVELVAALAQGRQLAFQLLRPGAQGYTLGDAFTVPIRANPSRLAVTLVDREHDGDLDVFSCWTEPTGTSHPLRCIIGTNDGSAELDLRDADEHGIAAGDLSGAAALAVGFTDFDNDRDIDLWLLHDRGLRLFSNQRDGSFSDVTEEVGLDQTTLTGPRAAHVTDINKDGYMDWIVADDSGLQLLLNDRGRLEQEILEGSQAAGAGLIVFDHDNDGFLDLLASTADGLQLLRNLGHDRFATVDAALSDVGTLSAARPLAAWDADGDGDLDLAVRDGTTGMLLLINEGGNANGWVSVVSVGVGDNRLGVGAKVEVLAGALRQKFEVVDALPLHVGLGKRERVQTIRHLWPSGVLQDEVDLAAGGPREVTQLDRKGTSCPLLYAWTAEGWSFVTDFLGGAAVGYRVNQREFGFTDTDEYIKIETGLVAEDGWLKLRLNNQLEEVLWFDQVELVVVDHPEGTQVFPNERLMPGPPWPEFQLFAGAAVRPVQGARTVENERDVTAVLAERDRSYVDDFRKLRFKGYAEPHTLELDLGDFKPGERVVLLLDGWIDYADSSSRVAADQAGVQLSPPRLQLADGNGGFFDATQRMGFPAGLPKTMAFELKDAFPSNDHRVRIATNMRIYWDQARVLIGGAETPLELQRLTPDRAELRFGGFPRPTSSDGKKPLVYDPNRVERISPWKAHTGRYTAFGDVLPLLTKLDDRMVTTKSGDEIELAFRAPGPPAPGWSRSYLLFADGFGKDMDPNSAANNTVGPVPFHGMAEYPYVGLRPIAAHDDGGRLVSPSATGWPGARPMTGLEEAGSQ